MRRNFAVALYFGKVCDNKSGVTVLSVPYWTNVFSLFAACQELDADLFFINFECKSEQGVGSSGEATKAEVSFGLREFIGNSLSRVKNSGDELPSILSKLSGILDIWRKKLSLCPCVFGGDVEDFAPLILCHREEPDFEHNPPSQSFIRIGYRPKTK